MGQGDPLGICADNESDAELIPLDDLGFSCPHDIKLTATKAGIVRHHTTQALQDGTTDGVPLAGGGPDAVRESDMIDEALELLVQLNEDGGGNGDDDESAGLLPDVRLAPKRNSHIAQFSCLQLSDRDLQRQYSYCPVSIPKMKKYPSCWFAAPSHRPEVSKPAQGKQIP